MTAPGQKAPPIAPGFTWKNDFIGQFTTKMDKVQLLIFKKISNVSKTYIDKTQVLCGTSIDFFYWKYTPPKMNAKRGTFERKELSHVTFLSQVNWWCEINICEVSFTLLSGIENLVLDFKAAGKANIKR